MKPRWVFMFSLEFIKRLLYPRRMREAAIGELVIGHQDGDLVFTVDRATYGISSPTSPNGSPRLWIDIETDEPSEDHPMSELGAPHLTAANISVTGVDDPALIGKEFEFRFDPDDDYDEDAPTANLYVSQHVRPHFSRIEIQADVSGDLLLIWTGECEDINYYDERAQDNRFQVRCILTKGLDFDHDAIRSRGGYILYGDYGCLFSFHRCRKCGKQFLLGPTERKRIERWYLDPEDLTQHIDAAEDDRVCPRDSSTPRTFEKLFLDEEDHETIVQSAWSWAVR